MWSSLPGDGGRGSKEMRAEIRCRNDNTFFEHLLCDSTLLTFYTRDLI